MTIRIYWPLIEATVHIEVTVRIVHIVLVLRITLILHIHRILQRHPITHQLRQQSKLILSDKLLVKYRYLDESSVQKDYLGDVCCDIHITKAIKAFQEDAKLKTDGIAGSVTISKLQHWFPELGDRVLKKGMYGSDVAELIKVLIAQDLLSDSDIEDEQLFDEHVEKAVKSFQKDHNIPATGIIDNKTLSILIKL